MPESLNKDTDSGQISSHKIRKWQLSWHNLKNDNYPGTPPPRRLLPPAIHNRTLDILKPQHSAGALWGREGLLSSGPAGRVQPRWLRRSRAVYHSDRGSTLASIPSPCFRPLDWVNAVPELSWGKHHGTRQSPGRSSKDPNAADPTRRADHPQSHNLTRSDHHWAISPTRPPDKPQNKSPTVRLPDFVDSVASPSAAAARASHLWPDTPAIVPHARTAHNNRGKHNSSQLTGTPWICS